MSRQRGLFSDWPTEDDEFAPLKMFLFGSSVSAIAGIVVALCVDPRDIKLLAMLVGFCVFFGGGIFAAFVVPPRVFQSGWHLYLHLLQLGPLQGILAFGLFPLFMVLGGLLSLMLGAVGSVYVIVFSISVLSRYAKRRIAKR